MIGNPNGVAVTDGDIVALAADSSWRPAALRRVLVLTTIISATHGSSTHQATCRVNSEQVGGPHPSQDSVAQQS
ncbi:hypothetical protein [Micromonospora schwarzwaldensis]|uniref:hypothetical protein n=1 Tax=Micromonospora sp. DSM 45708 TaxID=3111767 RepID=UPI0031D13EF7